MSISKVQLPLFLLLVLFSRNGSDIILCLHRSSISNRNVVHHYSNCICNCSDTNKILDHLASLLGKVLFCLLSRCQTPLKICDNEYCTEQMMRHLLNIRMNTRRRKKFLVKNCRRGLMNYMNR